MVVLVNKSNNEDVSKFIFGFDQSNPLGRLYEIDNIKGELSVTEVPLDSIRLEEWHEEKHYTSGGTLINEFLRMDYKDSK
jgi:hypothetical protein